MQYRFHLSGLILSAVFSISSAIAGEESLHRRTFLHEFSFGDGPVCVYFFDADSTLRPVIRPGVPVSNAREVRILPFVADEIRHVNAKGCLVWIISNQLGVGLGHVSMEDADAAMMRTVELIRRQGAVIHGYDFAEFNDGDRKPATGMMRRLEDLIRQKTGRSGEVIDKTRSAMVGDFGWRAGRPAVPAANGRPARPEVPADIRPDGITAFSHDNTDRIIAERFGITFIEAAQFFGWPQRLGVRAIDTVADLDRVMETFNKSVRFDPNGSDSLQSQSRVLQYYAIISEALLTALEPTDGTAEETLQEEAFYTAAQLTDIAKRLRGVRLSSPDLFRASIMPVVANDVAQESARVAAAQILARYVNTTLNLAGYGKPAPRGFLHNAYLRYRSWFTLRQSSATRKNTAFAATHALAGAVGGAGLVALSHYVGAPLPGITALWGAVAGLGTAASSYVSDAAIEDSLERRDRAAQGERQSAALIHGLRVLNASLRNHDRRTVLSLASVGIVPAEFAEALSMSINDTPLSVSDCAQALGGSGRLAPRLR